MDFAVSADHRIKIKESEKIDKNSDIAWEGKKKTNCGTWEWHVIPNVASAVGTVHKSLEKRLEELEIRGKIETIQATALFRLARLFRKVPETWED